MRKDRVIDRVIEFIFEELRKAETKHPGWPTDAIHGAAIVAEEAGELVRAAINYQWADGSALNMADEAAQTAACAIRFLLAFPHYYPSDMPAPKPQAAEADSLKLEA